MSDQEVADLDNQLKEEFNREIPAPAKKPYVKPFSMSYALRTTTRNMRRDIDVSIRIVSERIGEFATDMEKSREIFETLAELYAMRRMMDEYQRINADKFRNKRGVKSERS